MSAESERDKALKRVLGNASAEWNKEAYLHLVAYASEHAEFIGEEFRLAAIAAGCPEPHHHNAWGAFLNASSRKVDPVIWMTDRQKHMKTEQSHARRSPVWRSSVCMLRANRDQRPA